MGDVRYFWEVPVAMLGGWALEVLRGKGRSDGDEVWIYLKA